MNLITKDDIGIPISRIGYWMDNYYEWVKFHTRDKNNLVINGSNLVAAHYHVEEGRGGYFAPESGTSEGQILTARGFLNAYLLTKDTKWLNIAEELMEVCIEHLYRGKPVPDKFDEDNLWLPHWLFNVKNPFVAEQYYLNHVVKFTNGTATFTTDYTARKIFSVRALDADLEWENPFSDILGQEYRIKSYSASDKSFNIQLDEKYTGELKVVYSDLGGPEIEVNQMYEAWPIWRELEDTEIACAIDSLFWIYDCYKILYEVTGREKWKKAFEVTRDAIPFACDVSNMNDYITSQMREENPYSTMGTYSYQDRYPEATIKRNKIDGSIEIEAKNGSGVIQFGKGSIEMPFKEDGYYETKLTTDRAMLVDIIVATEKEYNEESRYTAKVRTNGSTQKFKLYREDFVKIGSVIWDLFYLEGLSWEDTYKSDNSKVSMSTVYDSNGKDIRKIDFYRGIESNYEGYEYLGWAQYEPIWDRELEVNNYQPITYKSNGAINVRLTDAKGYYWGCTLPISSSYRKFTPKAEFLYEHQDISGTPSSFTFPLTQMVFDAVDEECTMHIQRIGQLEDMPKNTTLHNMLVSTSEESAFKLNIHYLRPLPAEEYTYVPYVAPFTVNTLNNRLDNWRGTAYTGYQAPYIWQELNNPKGLDVVLNFLLAAQNEYYKRNNIDGFFMPVFIWDRWDSREYGEANTFSWNGPDTNTHWGGFQYRCIETVGRTLYNEPDNVKAKEIVYRFLKAIDYIWTDYTEYIPTDFPEGKKPFGTYDDPHSAGILLRCCVYAYKSNAIDRVLCLRLIKKCVLYLDRMFNDSPVDDFNKDFTRGTWRHNSEWYMYWGGEILSALCLLLTECQDEIYLSTNEGKMTVDTYPDNIDIGECLKVKTPHGIQKVELVDINNERATPIRIKTENGIKAVKGGKAMSNNELYLYRLNMGNAMRTYEKTYIHNELIGIQDGCIKIDSIRGKSIKNISPRKSYNYLEDNWINVFYNIEPNTEYTILFDITKPSSIEVMITKAEFNASREDSNWHDICSVSSSGKIAFTFTTAADSVGFKLYLQQEGLDVEIDNIMVVRGKYEAKDLDYFTGFMDSCSITNNKTLEITTESKDFTQKKTISILDALGETLLPLRSTEDQSVYDEIKDNKVYKRVDIYNQALAEPQVITLKDGIGLIECFEGGKILYENCNLIPDITIRYPMIIEDLIADVLNNK